MSRKTTWTKTTPDGTLLVTAQFPTELPMDPSPAIAEFER
jgi:hypothetical protein